MGFLTDPDGEYGKYYNPDVVSFEKIRDTPCLILLGEPGIGKSQAIEDEIEYLKKEISAKDELLLWIDLKECDSADCLRKDLFESDIWKKFEDGKNKLYIFLDSLDVLRKEMIKKGTMNSLLDCEILKRLLHPRRNLSRRDALTAGKVFKFWDLQIIQKSAACVPKG